MSYKYHLRTEVHEREQGGIENGIPFEWWDIGMVRNATVKKKMKVYMKPSPHLILDQNVPLRGWYKDKCESKGVRCRPCFTEALLTQPYGGTCPLRCIFCYINNGVRGYRGQGVTTVDPNYPDKIEKQLLDMKFGWNAYISSYTEPFQPLESIYHNTEKLSDIITGYGLPIFYLTRQIPPDWAVKYLLKSKYSYHQFSIITSDREDYKKLCPGAAPLDDILRYMKTVLAPQGIYLSIQVDPIIIGITRIEHILRLLEELKASGVNHVIFKSVEVVHSSVVTLVQKMKDLFGEDRGKNFESLLNENTSGVKNIQCDVRQRWWNTLRRKSRELGMTSSLCFEYAKNSDQSIGFEYCTADQCHGKQTPIHKKVNGKFVPWEVCPPSGCLYCKESVGFPPPCGKDWLQEARALKPKDYLNEV
jgi:DNA repair photolyase